MISVEMFQVKDICAHWFHAFYVASFHHLFKGHKSSFIVIHSIYGAKNDAIESSSNFSQSSKINVHSPLVFH